MFNVTVRYTKKGTAIKSYTSFQSESSKVSIIDVKSKMTKLDSEAIPDSVEIMQVEFVCSSSLEQEYSGAICKAIPEGSQCNDAKHDLVREARRKMEFRLGMMGFGLTVDQYIPLQAVWIALENTMRNMNFNNYISKEQR